MKQVYTMFGMRVVASSHHGAMKGFSKQNFTRIEEISDYLKEVATRVQVLSGIVVRTDSLDNFMEDMLSSKMIKIKPTE